MSNNKNRYYKIGNYFEKKIKLINKNITAKDNFF